MLHLIRSKSALQLRSCAGLLYQVNHQSSLASCATQTIVSDRPLDGLQIGRLGGESPIELANRPGKHILLSKATDSRISEHRKREEKEQNELKKIMEQLDLKSADRPVDLKLKSSLNPDYDPHLNKPDKEQLEAFYKYIEQAFPKFFSDKVDLTYFEQHVVIEDSLSGQTKKEMGYNQLITKISFIRIYHSVLYSQNNMNVLGIAKIPEEGVVKLRWRIVSKGKAFIFLQFWKVNEMRKREYWNDGIAYFYLNRAGKVRKIVLERVEKSKEEEAKLTPEAIQKLAKV